MINKPCLNTIIVLPQVHTSQKENMHSSLFKTQELQDRYLQAYDDVLSLWPVEYESRFVITRFGETHTLICGPQDAPPLVLLHGFGVNATMWIPLVETLSKSFRIYALDTIGDLGKSVPVIPLKQAGDYNLWLQDVYHELNINEGYLAGFSQGGWIALNFAIHGPKLLKKLVLLSPNAGLVTLNPQFMLRLMTMAVFPFASLVEKWASWNSLAWDKTQPFFMMLSRLTQAGVSGQKPSRPGVMPSTFSDAELQAIDVPVLMLVGDKEVVNNPLAALERAKLQIPDFEGCLIKEASHMLPFDQPQQVCDHILDFCM
jgi:pimeloyl-ACP methyl ester carboxylesterase